MLESATYVERLCSADFYNKGDCMKKLYNMLIKENEEKGGYEAKEIEENIAEIHRLQAANV